MGPFDVHRRHRPDPADPVAPARRSPGADAKAGSKTTTHELPATSFTTLLDHLGCLARVDLRYGDHDTGPTGTILRRSAGAVTGAIVVFVLPYILGSFLSGSAQEWLFRLTPAAGFAVLGTLPRSAQVS